MAKFNLSSVYSKDNIYSVLKLLKALIDTLDNYEFQPPIKDRDGNEIPNEWFAKLYNSIHGSYNGDIEVGKDAHIDGNINVDLDATIGGLIKLGASTIFAYVDYPNSSGAVPAIMSYRIEEGAVIVDTAIAFDTNSAMLLYWYNLDSPTYANGVYTTAQSPVIIDLSSIDVNAIGGLYGDVTTLKTQVKNKQGKLYLHCLTLTSKDDKVYTIAKLNWYSTSNLEANSLPNLTTLINPKKGWTCGVTALDMDMSQGIPKIENTAIDELLYSPGAIWRFTTPISKGLYPLTEVSDSVTAVD